MPFSARATWGESSTTSATALRRIPLLPLRHQRLLEELRLPALYYDHAIDRLIVRVPETDRVLARSERDRCREGSVIVELAVDEDPRPRAHHDPDEPFVAGELDARLRQLAQLGRGGLALVDRRQLLGLRAHGLVDRLGAGGRDHGGALHRELRSEW